MLKFKNETLFGKMVSEIIVFSLAFATLRIMAVLSYLILIAVVLLLGFCGVKITAPESEWVGLSVYILGVLLSLSTTLLIKQSKHWLIYMIISILCLTYLYGFNWS